MTELLLGDCLEVLTAMEDSSVDSIVTDPPYGISFMGRKWDYDVPSVEIWEQCLRVLKPGGHLLAFAGTRTQHRMCVNIEDAGFEIRDMIAWVYGSGFPKSQNVGKKLEGWDGWGTALKPALEPITVARKPFKGTVAGNVLEHGTGAINIDGCRVADGSETGKKKPAYKPNKLNAVYGSGMGGGDWQNINGRWPANLIHDGSDEVTELFPQAKPSKSGGKSGLDPGMWAGKKQFERGGHDDNGGSAARFFQQCKGSAARFKYCAKANKKDRGEGNNHPTVKPTDLMAYLVRLVTPPGGVVLDPFMGSGSTGKACKREGFNFIGCDLDPDFVELARKRIEEA